MTVIEINIYFSNLLIIIEDHPVVLSHPLTPSFPVSNVSSVSTVYSLRPVFFFFLLVHITLPFFVHLLPISPYNFSHFFFSYLSYSFLRRINMFYFLNDTQKRKMMMLLKWRQEKMANAL